MNTDPETLAGPLLARVLDDDMIAAEFEAIIAAEWPKPQRQKAIRPCRYRWQRNPNDDGVGAVSAVGEFREINRPSRSGWAGRQRSPPPD